LVLVDNAVKYAFANTEVFVTIEDRGTRTSVEVTSQGYIVPPEDATRIFDKEFRSEGAKRLASSGSGLGLYIAQTVAEANGFSIRYQSYPDENDDRIGENTFSFAVY